MLWSRDITYQEKAIGRLKIISRNSCSTLVKNEKNIISVNRRLQPQTVRHEDESRDVIGWFKYLISRAVKKLRDALLALR